MIETIGILGGGQLGRMSAIAALRLGLRCHVFTPEPDSPASDPAATVSVASYDDADALMRFAHSVDVMTFEFENISTETLATLDLPCPLRPSLHTLRTSQDRAAEKSFLNGIGVQTARWALLTSDIELPDQAASIGFPAIAKTTLMGYDGKGQQQIGSLQALQSAWRMLNPKPLILEQLVDFKCECSVIVARNKAGQTVTFDTVENRHRHHILDITLAPARLPTHVIAETQAIARHIADAMQLEGVLAVEMFIGADNEIVVNELAPRPHNSGHWSLDACSASQFELHIRAVADLPLFQPVRHSDAVMRNLVGPDDMALVPGIMANPGLIPHLYGKRVTKPGRKMGHVTHLFPRGALPGDYGVDAALGTLARQALGEDGDAG